MIDTRFLRGSDGTGNAVAARVNTQRLVGSTTLKVDSTSKWPTTPFIVTIGSLDVNGYLTGVITEARATIVAGDIIISSFEPGYTDVGNTVNQYAILKQTTGWANLNQDATAELQNEIVLRDGEELANFVQAGGIWTNPSTLNGSMTAGIAYHAGYRGSFVAIATRGFTASKDTYVDLLRVIGVANTTTFTVVYTEAVNGGAAPALAANSIRLAKVITNATNITAIQQSGVSDSFGNIIYPIGATSAASIQNPYKFQAYKDASFQNLPRNTPTKIRFEVEEYDSGNNFDSVTNYRFTAPVAGYYKFDARVGWGQATADFCFIHLYKNGLRFKYGNSSVAPGNNSIGLVVSPPPLFLNAGDYVEIWCQQTSATTDPAIFGNQGECYFGGYLVSRS